MLGIVGAVRSVRKRTFRSGVLVLVISWVSGLVVVWGSWYRVGIESICSVYGVSIVCILGGSVDLDGLADRVIVPRTATDRGPHRLVVRTSRRGRDNPGSTRGVVKYFYS